MVLETCLILGQVSHNSLCWKKKLLTDTCGPGERLTRKQLTSRPYHLRPELWKSMGKHAKLKEIPAAKAAVDKEWEKLEKISAWNLAKVRSKKTVIEEARTAGATVHFASLVDICHLKMLNWRQSTRNTKVELYSAVIL